MKPLTQPAGPPPESVAAVRRLLGRLESIGETFAVAALDDDGLGPIATAVTGAADLAGRWLTRHDASTIDGPSEAVAMAAALEPFEREGAAGRKGASNDERVKFTGSDKGSARDKIAAAVGMSAPTVAPALPADGPGTKPDTVSGFDWDDLFAMVAGPSPAENGRPSDVAPVLRRDFRGEFRV